MHRYLLLFIIGAALLVGGYRLCVSPALGIVSWGDPDELRIDPPEKFTADASRPLDLELSGSGLASGTRAWLVPEASQRLAVRKALNTWGQPQHMVRQGNRVYVANNLGGLLLLDVSNWSAPTLLGSLKTPGHALDLVVRGEMVFLASGQQGLQVVDCSDPLAPRLVASLATPGPAVALTLTEQTLFLACARHGVLAIDIANPRQPFLAGQLGLAEIISDVAASGTTLLVALGNKGLVVADTADRRTPRERIRLHPPGAVRLVTFSGQTALVASGRNAGATDCQLRLYDLPPGLPPQLLSAIPLAGSPLDMTVENARVTIAVGENGVEAFSIRDPLRPVAVQHLAHLGRIRSVVTAGEWTLLADGRGLLKLVRADEQLQLPVLGQVASAPLSFSYVPPLQRDHLLVVPTRDEVLEIFDVTTPSTPRRLSNMTLSGELLVLEVAGGRLFLGMKRADGTGLLQVWSLSDPQQPQLQVSVPCATPVGTLAVGRKWLVTGEFRNDLNEEHPGQTQVRHRPGLLQVFDLTAATMERPTGTLELPDDVQALALDGDTVYALQSGGTLHAIYLGTGRQPRIVDSLQFSWLHSPLRPQRASIKVQQQTAILFNSETELAFVDISSPRRLVLLGTSEMPGTISMLETDEQLLFVGLYDRGILVYDISHPWHPQRLGLLPVATGSQTFALGTEVLWLGGNNRLGLDALPRPQPTETRTNAGGDRLELHIDRPQVPGDYSLWVERNNVWQEVPNCIHFSGEG